ncbi:hypothetical protein E5082_11400 [Streptomyces griseoluteus]|uniref:Uncharacterized protein n=1 Tax=Streptomyces griseoluteus TaxID=29306 RepID=A0A4Z1DQ58_STRGP|nr:hypothetical protein E5082_11400 [Streptomyces griseoluteus]
MQQHQRITPPHPLVRDGHILRPGRGGNLEGDGGGHTKLLGTAADGRRRQLVSNCYRRVAPRTVSLNSADFRPRAPRRPGWRRPRGRPA